jgi:5-methylcytosine-specific restriction endonuclease McrA
MNAPINVGRPWNGSKWIRPETRLRIYARDGWRCVWCPPDAPRTPREHLTLDHFLSVKAGGGNETTNLLTACHRCNSQRGDTPALTFAFRKDGLLFGGPLELLDRLLDALERPLPRFVP